MSRPKRLVLDTSVVIYLLSPEPRAGQEEVWRGAQELRRINEDEWRLCLPTPALGEVLAGVPLKKQDKTAEILSRMFEILDYDKESALIAGRIALAGIRGRKKVGKQAVKIDIEIIACAARWRASGLCALDGDHHRIVELGKLELLVGGPSKFTPPQQPLFQEQEEEE